MKYEIAFFNKEWHAGYFRVDGSFMSLGASVTKTGALQIKDELYRAQSARNRYMRQQQKLCGIRY